MKYSVCLELFFTDLPIERRIAEAKKAGFDTGEIWEWRGRDLVQLRSEANRHQFSITSLLAAGMEYGLNDPANHRQIKQMVVESMDAAQLLGCRQLIVLAGDVLPRVTRSAQLAAIVQGLRALTDVAEQRGIVLLLEFLNSRYDHPGYLLDNSEEMCTIIQAVNHPSVRALYDIYHAGIMEGNIIENIRANVDLIGHYHLAGIPGRHEPDLGEQNYPVICQEIDALGYKGFMGLEYQPTIESSVSLKRTLTWLRNGSPNPTSDTE